MSADTRNRINKIISGCMTRGMSSEAITDEVWEYLNLNSGWQPIETAPKDGTRFIGGHYEVRITRPNIFLWYVAIWAKEGWIPTDDEGFGIEGNDGEFYCPSGFYREELDSGDEVYRPAKPTHWLQIPHPTTD